MLELPIIKFAFEHLGTIGGVLVLLILLALRFMPGFQQALREKAQAAADRRREEKEWREREREEMRRRAMDAEADLRKILTNHIAHLEARSEAQLSFEQAAVTQLGEMTHQLKELRREQQALILDLRDIGKDVSEIKGAH